MVFNKFKILVDKYQALVFGQVRRGILILIKSNQFPLWT